MNTTQLIGISASIGTGINLLAQLIKIVREKKSDISLGMMAVLMSGLILWILYGIKKEDWIIISSNVVSLVLNLCIIFISIRYKRAS